MVGGDDGPAPRAAAGPLPELDTPSADDPLDVLLVGDSYMYDAAPGIAAALEATGTANAVQAGMFGFTITDDRGGDTLRRLVAEHRPDLVVTMWAAFDAAWLADHDADEYRRLLDAAMEDLTAGGTTVVVIGFAPSMTPGIDPEPVDRTINRYLADLPARFPGSVLYLDPDPVVAPSGEASRWLDTGEGRLLVRKVDLGHFCGDGAARFGSAVGELVGWLTGAPAADPAEWWAGSWRTEPRYDDPPGACAA